MILHESTKNGMRVVLKQFLETKDFGQVMEDLETLIILQEQKDKSK